MNSIPAIGWAYRTVEGIIDLRSVSDTKQSAMINAIVSRSLGKIVPLESWTKDDMEKAFVAVKGGGDLVRIKVQEMSG